MSHGSKRRAGSPRTWKAVFVAWIAGGLASLAAASGTGDAVSKPVPPPSNQVFLPRGRPLPDSVLALVGSRPAITVSKFLQAWRQANPGSPATSRPPGGVPPDSLTPQAAREFLDLLIDKEALAERALRERWTWTALESAGYRSLRDRLTLHAVLDPVLAETARRRAAAGQSELDAEALGILARDSCVALIHPTFDDALLARLATAFDTLPRPTGGQSIMEQVRLAGANPVVTPADSLRVLANSDEGPWRVADLLENWKRLNPIYRPRITNAGQVRDLARNGLYERQLRSRAARAHVERRPEIVGALRERAEYVAVTHLVAREVYAKIPQDSSTHRRYFDAHVERWDLPDRAQVVRLVFPDRASAAAMAKRLASRVEAESLAAMGRREGAEFSGEVSAESDSALYAEAVRLGVDAVAGPDSTAEGWRVARIVALHASRHRTYEEASELVQRAWYGEDGERRMRALLDGLRKRTRVIVHLRALDRAPWTAPR